MLEITLRTEIKDKNGHNLTHSLAQQDFFICTTVLGRGFSKCKAPCKAKCLKTLRDPLIFRDSNNSKCAGI